ncbi:MAG: hypothetical protein V7L11_21950 [Nostoc sp.]|uniref:hypothetical protein n=1 Tax=Nostoc sp. TaxID=1180 RepID=UPI002FFC6900
MGIRDWGLGKLFGDSDHYPSFVRIAFAQKKTLPNPQSPVPSPEAPGLLDKRRRTWEILARHVKGLLNVKHQNFSANKG